MSSSVGLPDIPGMWYDSTRNRYFRITADNRPPPSPPPPPPRKPRKTLSQSSQSILFRAETNHIPHLPQALSASLLANAHAKHIERFPWASASQRTNLPDGLLMSQKCSKLALLSYPSGAVMDHVSSLYEKRVLAYDWNAAGHTLAWALDAHREEGPYWNLFVCTFGEGHSSEHEMGIEGRNGSHFMFFSLDRCPHAVGLQKGTSNSDACAASGDGVTEVFVLSDGGFGGRPRYLLKHRDGSSGMVVAFPKEREVWTGTRGGSLYRWDLRAPRRAVCSFMPCRRQNSVVDLKLRGREVYVSCMRNGVKNLGMWDDRMVGGRMEAVLVYKGHVNSHKRLRFDVDEETGLLVAGGDDGVVRIWNAGTGGECIGVNRSFGRQVVENVKLAGWRANGSARPGAWVVTNNGIYCMQIG